MNRINTICLGVRDMRASSRFYRDGLGFETLEAKENPKIVFFNTQGTKFELIPIQALMRNIGIEKDTCPPSGFNGMTLKYQTKKKEDVDQIVHLARNAGATVLKETQAILEGAYHAYFSDPDGYVWEVAWSPDFVFDENNMLEL